MKQTGVLLVNLGTPDSPRPSDVRRYLLEFLTDGRVIDFKWLPRQLLVRGIIVPFRYRSSAKTYGAIWDDERGSPLLYHSQALHEKVANRLADAFDVRLVMRYQHPAMTGALEDFRRMGYDRIVVFPLFPQYASSTTGSIHQKVMGIVSGWQAIPEVLLISDYFDAPGFIDAFAERIRRYHLPDYDHVLFSYHGLPERHLRKSDPTGSHCLKEGFDCCTDICGDNRYCYRAQCAATTRALVKALRISEDQYTMCFQSRLGRDPWIRPYTSDVLEQLAGGGVKRILAVCPAFVADCLETIFEIGVEYQEAFEAHGGEKVQLVESLNDADAWADFVAGVIRHRAGHSFQTVPVS